MLTWQQHPHYRAGMLTWLYKPRFGYCGTDLIQCACNTTGERAYGKGIGECDARVRLQNKLFRAAVKSSGPRSAPSPNLSPRHCFLWGTK